MSVRTLAYHDDCDGKKGTSMRPRVSVCTRGGDYLREGRQKTTAYYKYNLENIGLYKYEN